MPAHAAFLGDAPDGGLTLIHADRYVGRWVEHRLDREWLGRIVGAYRLAKLPLGGAALCPRPAEAASGGLLLDPTGRLPAGWWVPVWARY